MSVKQSQTLLQSLVTIIFINSILFLVKWLDVFFDLFISKKRKWQRSRKTQPYAYQVNPQDPYSPWRTCEFKEPLRINDPNANVYDEFEQFAHKCPNLKTLGVRQIHSISDEMQPNGKVFRKYDLGNYQWQTNASIIKRLVHISNGFLGIGLKPKENITIYSETRAEWLLSALSCFRLNVPVVTLYSTLGIEAVTFGVNESACKVIITDQLGKFSQILNDLQALTTIIVIGSNSTKQEIDEFKEKNANIKVYTFAEVESIGETVDDSVYKICRPKRDDLAVIMYTSGSTGNPKGVMISHKNLLAASKSFPLRVGSVSPGSHIWVSYLPLAHILELCAELGSIISGIRLGYSSAQTLVDNSTGIKRGQKGDLRVLKPTMMACVPLILERFSKAVNDKISKAGWFTQTLFDKAYDQKLVAIRKGQKTFFLNRLVFNKISRAVLGGKCKSILCGASMLSESVQEYIQVCLAPTRQAYALTETCAAGTGQYEWENDTKIVGSPVAAAEIRLVDWIEGGYRATDKPYPRGEIYIGGDSVTVGYYKNDEKTREDYHEIDGIRYFATGDIGEMMPNGSLKIIDRKKDLVKLLSGEYISLAKIEVILKQLPFVENCCVYADSFKSYCVCLICPDVQKLVYYAKTLKFDDVKDYKSIVSNKELLKLIQKDIIEHCEKQRLERVEIPQRFKLVEETWLPDTGLVTATFKIKRNAIEKFYKSDLDVLNK